MYIKSLLLTASVSVFAFTGANAADAIVYNEPAPVAVDTFSWTGGYIGVNAGYAGGKFKHPFALTDELENETLISGSLKVTSSGFVGGIQAGYNWQMDNNIVFGLETDIQASSVKGEISGHLDTPLGSGSAKAGTKVTWFGTTRARLGYTPVERFMVYATGGIAYGKVKSYAEFLDNGISKSKTKVGYTLGAGAEYAFTNNWTLKSEYLYTDLGKTTLVNYVDEDFGFNLKNKVNFHTVRVGLNYKF